MIIISFKLETKIFLFKLYYYFSRLIAFFFQKKEDVFCYPRGFIFAPSRGQRMSALRDLFPLKFRNLRKILRAFDKADDKILKVLQNLCLNGYSSFIERRGRLEKHNLAKIEISENLDVFLLPVS
jgi:hypothetical protein